MMPAEIIRKCRNMEGPSCEVMRYKVSVWPRPNAFRAQEESTHIVVGFDDSTSIPSKNFFASMRVDCFKYKCAEL